MAQARARRAAALVGRTWRADARRLPSDAIACAVREPLFRSEALASWAASGSCVHQADVARRILRERFGVEASVVGDDLMRPMGGGRSHSYTLADGSINAEAGAFHAWLHLDDDQALVDLAA